MEFYSEAINHTWEISPKAVNTLSCFDPDVRPQRRRHGRQEWQAYLLVALYHGQRAFLLHGGISGEQRLNGGYTEPSQEVRTHYGVYETFSKTVGKHLISVGATPQHQYAKEDAQYPAQAILSFNGQYTGNAWPTFF